MPVLVAGTQGIGVRAHIEGAIGEIEAGIDQTCRGLGPVDGVHDQDAACARGRGAEPADVVDEELGGARDRAAVDDDHVRGRGAVAQHGVEGNGAAGKALAAGDAGHRQGLGGERRAVVTEDEVPGQVQVSDRGVAGHGPSAVGVDAHVRPAGHRAGQRGACGQGDTARAAGIEGNIARQRGIAGREGHGRPARDAQQGAAAGAGGVHRHVGEIQGVAGIRGPEDLEHVLAGGHVEGHAV